MIFKTAAAAILDFQKFEILMVDSLAVRVNMHHRTQFHQNRSNSCVDMAIYRFLLNMAAFRHLGFVVGRVFGPPMMSTRWSFVVQNLVGIDAVVLIILTFQYFAR